MAIGEDDDVDIDIIDAHFHLWALDEYRYPWLQDDSMIPFRYGDYGAIRRDYLIADYQRDSSAHNISAAVHMEAEWRRDDPVAETRWVQGIAERHGFPNAIVAQAWFGDDNIAAVLSAHAAFPLVRGVRQKPPAAPTPERVIRGASLSMDDPVWRDGYALLARHDMSYDLQTPYWHLPEAAELARDFPATTVILDHTGLPVDRTADGLSAWRRALEEFAEAPNTYLKISGLGIAARPWRVDENRPIIEDAISIFSVDRCMFASNFPVDGLVADFDIIFDGFKEVVRGLPLADRKKLFFDNALRVYCPKLSD